jgi:hypothetical protein
LKRLALFWLACAAAGFAVAASLAIVLSVVLGGGGGLPPAAAQTTVRALEMRPRPKTRLRAAIRKTSDTGG